ncbi:hypothetical protein [Enterococcus sp. LJL90]
MATRLNEFDEKIKALETEKQAYLDGEAQRVGHYMMEKLAVTSFDDFLEAYLKTTSAPAASVEPTATSTTTDEVSGVDSESSGFRMGDILGDYNNN